MLRSCLYIAAGLALAIQVQPAGAETIVSTTLTKVADLPGGTADAVPKNPRGGILQLGNELWFTTYNGGTYNEGAILSYDLATGAFTTEYSFGRTIPSDPSTAGYAGVNPYKLTLTLGGDGLVYYSTVTGGNTPNSPFANGGAIGNFNPNTIGTAGVNVLWSGGAGSGATIGAGGIPGYAQPRNFGYSDVIYLPTASGASIYAMSLGGGLGNGSSGGGTVQKISLDSTGGFVAQTQVTQFTGTNGRGPQGGLLLVDKGEADRKIYYTTSAIASSSLLTLQVVDTATDTVTVLSDTWGDPDSAAAGGYSTPIYDASRDMLYTVALNGRVLMYDLQTNTQSIHGAVVGNSNFADPILFGDSIYFIRQGGSATLAGGQIWRFDLEGLYSEKLYDLAMASLSALYQPDFSLSEGSLSAQSGSFSVVEYNGEKSLYYLTNQDTNGANNGQLYRLDIVAVPEPATIGLLALGGLLVLVRRRRAARGQ